MQLNKQEIELLLNWLENQDSSESRNDLIRNLKAIIDSEDPSTNASVDISLSEQMLGQILSLLNQQSTSDIAIFEPILISIIKHNKLSTLIIHIQQLPQEFQKYFVKFLLDKIQTKELKGDTAQDILSNSYILAQTLDSESVDEFDQWVSIQFNRTPRDEIMSKIFLVIDKFFEQLTKAQKKQLITNFISIMDDKGKEIFFTESPTLLYFALENIENVLFFNVNYTQMYRNIVTDKTRLIIEQYYVDRSHEWRPGEWKTRIIKSNPYDYIKISKLDTRSQEERDAQKELFINKIIDALLYYPPSHVSFMQFITQLNDPHDEEKIIDKLRKLNHKEILKLMIQPDYFSRIIQSERFAKYIHESIVYSWNNMDREIREISREEILSYLTNPANHTKRKAKTLIAQIFSELMHRDPTFGNTLVGYLNHRGSDLNSILLKMVEVVPDSSRNEICKDLIECLSSRDHPEIMNSLCHTINAKFFYTNSDPRSIEEISIYLQRISPYISVKDKRKIFWDIIKYESELARNISPEFVWCFLSYAFEYPRIDDHASNDWQPMIKALIEQNVNNHFLDFLIAIRKNHDIRDLAKKSFIDNIYQYSKTQRTMMSKLSLPKTPTQYAIKTMTRKNGSILINTNYLPTNIAREFSTYSFLSPLHRRSASATAEIEEAPAAAVDNSNIDNGGETTTIPADESENTEQKDRILSPLHILSERKSEAAEEETEETHVTKSKKF